MAATTIEHVLHIDAPPEGVWELISDTRRYADWVVNTDEVVRADSEVASLDTAYEERNTILGPWKGRTSWRVTKVDEGRHTIHSGDGLFIARWMELDLTVEPEGTGTRYTHRFRFAPALGRLGPLVARVLQPSIARDMLTSAHNLRALCEAPQAARPFPQVAGVEVEHRFVEARGQRFHVALAGPADGEPIVLVHGWPQHWYCWRKVLPALAEHYRVVMPDLRGHGWSDAPRAGYEKENLADDVLAILDELGLQRVKLMAHDWGGWTGFLMALREPARIERFLVLNMPPPWTREPNDPRGLLDLWRLWYQVLLASPLGVLIAGSQKVMAKFMRADNAQPDAFSDADLAQFTAALAEPHRARASSQMYRSFLLRELPGLANGRYDEQPLRVPTLLLFGEQDGAISKAQIERAIRPEDPFEVQYVPDSGHFIAEERPELVAARALAWFGARSEASTAA